ncbi:hypothetical protein LABALGNA3A7_05490 [Dellaglioa algida]|nr:hypothetical protein LABALGNA3A7_05490 [Dellaglioa algida]
MITLNKSNYYSNKTDWQYMSVSWFKRFRKCEASAVYDMNHPTENNALPLIVGNYVHSYFEGDRAHQDFIEEKKEFIYKNSKARYVAFDNADLMIKSLAKQPIFKAAYNGEREVILTGKLFDTNWKARIDCLNVEEGYFCDIKTSADIHKRFWNNEKRIWESFVDGYGYTLQMAIYSKLLELKYGKPFTPYIMAVTKSDIPDVAAIAIKPDDLAEQLRMVELELPNVLRVLHGEVNPVMCGKCDYCKEHKVVKNFIYKDDLIE